MKKYINHPYPVWRDIVNFVVGAKITGNIAENTDAVEQLWCRRISENTFEVCCIPFFLYDVALGDEIKTDIDYTMVEVIKQSGHFAFRVWFGNSKNLSIREDVINRIEKLGCLFEWYSNNLLAIDAPSDDLAKQLANYLSQKEQVELLIYETGRS